MTTSLGHVNGSVDSMSREDIAHERSPLHGRLRIQARTRPRIDDRDDARDR
jgi:hypothetical protein